MKVAVGSVIYAGALEYLTDFLQSLEEQSDQDFSIMLLNDNVPLVQLQSVISKQCKDLEKKIHIVDKYGQNRKIHELRVDMLKAAYEEEIELLIMLDIDDMASVNRVACTREQFDSRYTFFYNELLDFSKKPVMPELPQYTQKAMDIAESNYLGMSNGAIFLRNLTMDFIESLYQGESSVFDWYMYTRLLLNGAIGKKIEGAYTYYRIYDGNLAGRSVASPQMIEKELQVKRRHYYLLSGFCDTYKELYKSYQDTERNEIVPEEENGYWWSLIKCKKKDGQGE